MSASVKRLASSRGRLSGGDSRATGGGSATIKAGGGRRDDIASRAPARIDRRTAPVMGRGTRASSFCAWVSVRQAVDWRIVW